MDALLSATSEPSDSAAGQFRTFVDGTLGGGGHSELLLESTINDRVLGVDVDPEVVC